ncbi:MAG TPA: DUF4157 domain-containing protein, partial [Longimicrobiales bacterium]|nr:DUF4157 domain-containing protein [Longimicrobiales bacterium]
MSTALRVRRAPARPKAAASRGDSATSSSGIAAPASAWAGADGPALSLGVQRKPDIGEPGDAYEQEADAVSARVTAGQDAPALAISRVGAGGVRQAPQRAAEEDEGAVQKQEEDEGTVQKQEAEEETVQKQELDEEVVQKQEADEDVVQKQELEEDVVQKKDDEEGCGCGTTVGCACGVQRKGGAAATAAMESAAATAVRSPGPGAPLPAGTRGTLESRMGVDLGGVRVHTGPDAAKSSSALHARAFTAGSHVWLGNGESASDVSLMA